ncbi:MAG: OmpA/MotB family protein [Clostridium sp.]|uniref:OmpA/MotB family protein n=1 Tax=Clostridium TaxID=1485 RepID=UPI0021537ABC|nr:OmpA family protein [Clostridium sp. LY3-2]MCR6516385.1 OmpA family protein [Clostridium sp. LY3-2]
MKFRSRRYKREKEEMSYWPSFVDIMTTVTLVFFFIMLISMALSSLFVDNISKKRDAIYKEIQSKLDSNNVNKDVMYFNKEEGKIEIKTETLFDTGKWDLKKDGENLAKELNEVFYKILKDEKLNKEIDYIEIVGHTDYAGTTIDNRKLSTERAMSFLNSMVPINSDLENGFGGKFKASGMSEFETNPKKEDRDREKYSKNDMKAVKDQRKIEIKMVFSNRDLEEAIKSRNLKRDK